MNKDRLAAIAADIPTHADRVQELCALLDLAREEGVEHMRADDLLAWAARNGLLPFDYVNLDLLTAYG